MLAIDYDYCSPDPLTGAILLFVCAGFLALLASLRPQKPRLTRRALFAIQPVMDAAPMTNNFHITMLAPDELQQLQSHLDSASALVTKMRAGEAAPKPEPPPKPRVKRLPLVAIVVGHEPTKPGACNRAANVCEFQVNDWIADQILARGVSNARLVKVHRHPGSYAQLPAKVNALNPDLVLSLHANGFDGQVSGTEMLYAKGSLDGYNFAHVLQKKIQPLLGLPNRGVKTLTRKDDGSTLLFGVKAPAVIAEPFFIDNNQDFAVANEKIHELVDAYRDSIDTFIPGL